jgi:hypothetical protein
MGLRVWKSGILFVPSDALWRVLENARSALTLGVLITASGLQGGKPLVNRTM